MAELHRQKVTDLAQALEPPDTQTGAAEAIRASSTPSFSRLPRVPGSARRLPRSSSPG
jgi:hypothetical protein